MTISVPVGYSSLTSKNHFHSKLVPVSSYVMTTLLGQRKM